MRLLIQYIQKKSSFKSDAASLVSPPFESLFSFTPCRLIIRSLNTLDFPSTHIVNIVGFLLRVHLALHPIAR